MGDFDFNTLLRFYQSPVIGGLFIEVIFILLLSYLITSHSKNSVGIVFEIIYVKMYTFYEDIVGKEQPKWILNYVLTLFCVILFSNFLGVILELISPFFGMSGEGEFYLDHYIAIPSADINFNLAMALMSIAVLIYVQIKAVGVGAFLYQFVPYRGKGYIPMEAGDSSSLGYKVLSLLAKICDIIISIFLGLLDVTEYLARIVSLSFRLFGNMMSGGILLAMVFLGIGSLTTLIGKSLANLIGQIFLFFGVAGVETIIAPILSHNFPVVVPILLYTEDTMVAFIQAMVFALLISIFIRVALDELKEEAPLYT